MTFVVYGTEWTSPKHLLSNSPLYFCMHKKYRKKTKTHHSSLKKQFASNWNKEDSSDFLRLIYFLNSILLNTTQSHLPSFQRSMILSLLSSTYTIQRLVLIQALNVIVFLSIDQNSFIWISKYHDICWWNITEILTFFDLQKAKKCHFSALT